MKQSKSIIILLGPPGSGKGTQASILADKLGFYYFETSKIIEEKVMNAAKNDIEVVNGKEYSLLEEKQFWQKGLLCSPSLVAFWVKERIRELAGQGKSIIFAGSPRTLPEAKEIMPLIAQFYGKENIKIILFKLEPEQSIFRNSHRRICELFRHPILFNKETEKLTKCPLDGSKLIKRKKLDNPETIKIRLKQYEERTLPLIAYLQDNGYKIDNIDASATPAVIFENLFKSIK